MTHTFIARRNFYCAHRRSIDWGYFERIMGDWFFTERGKKRPEAPNDVEAFVNTKRDWMMENLNMGGKTPEQVRAGLLRALEDLLAEIDLRVTILREDVTAGVSLSQSLSLCQCDPVVIRLLRGSSYRTLRGVQKASDEALLSIKGIDQGRLNQVRAVIPRAEVPRPASPQLLLFAPPPVSAHGKR